MQDQTVSQPALTRASLFPELSRGLRNGTPDAEPVDRAALYALNSQSDTAYSLSSSSRNANRL